MESKIMILSTHEKKEFLSAHLPHRLTVLRSLNIRIKHGYNFTGQGDIYRCLQEGNLIMVRLFLNFMGLKGVCNNGVYELISMSETHHKDDVMIDMFIGHLIKPEDIPKQLHRILAGVYFRSDKELAHLTLTFTDEFNKENVLIEAAIIIEGLIENYLYKPLGMPLPEMDF